MKAGTRTIWTFVITSIALFIPRLRRPAEATSSEREHLVAQAEAA